MPLGDVEDDHLRRLCGVLWSWEFCLSCQANGSCSEGACPWQRAKHLQAFFRHFKTTTASYDSIEGPRGKAAIWSLEELFRALVVVQQNPRLTRKEMLEKVFGQSDDQFEPHQAKKGLALNTIVQIGLMTNCAAQEQALVMLESGLYGTPWHEAQSLVDFMESSFPKVEDEPHDQKSSNTLEFDSSVTAWRLKKEAGLSLQPTDNIRNHLRLDRKNNVVEVFHHTGFLKEQLRLSKNFPADLTTAEFLERGALPRQLILETLRTLQKVLFPQEDQKCRSFLHSLCSRYDFDRDCQRFEWTALRNEDEKDLSYRYWLERLEDLKQELENPRPKGLLEEWLERRSHPRYVMLATLVGVIIAIVLGAAGLAVSSYQAWIAYNAWKHPVPAPRTSAHASVVLQRRNVKPLLSIVGGKSTLPTTKPRQPSPEDVDASPKSTDTEDERPVPPFSKTVANTAVTGRKRKAPTNDRISKSKKKGVLLGQDQRHATTVAQAITVVDGPEDDDLELFPEHAMSSQRMKKARKYGSSQTVPNLHVLPKNKQNTARQEASGFKPQFHVPIPLLASPRSSASNTFIISRSSPPIPDAAHSSSALLSSSESPLSSPPPTPELEKANTTLVGGRIMIPCPLCRTLVQQASLEVFNNGNGLRWKDKMAFCQAHKQQDAKEQRSGRLYPDVDWSALPNRLLNLHPTIEAILERRKDSFYRNMLDESVTSGQARNAFRAVEDDGQANSVPGYYGLRGARMMQESILAAFAPKIRRLASRDKAMPRTGPAGYVQAVLAPEMAVMLVMQDFPGADEERARTILAESAEIGKMLADADDDTRSGKTTFRNDNDDNDD
ncbi:hypothetical protein FH972_026368 [Carpinus fangiana]|uniref:Restriction of telomere capping protein 4 n=1 Tax=Carpinus fangiana TaxID=176857 RepID=A0A5N6L3Q9_9ROSI|nr:hypothetical protein FH972_026368 [Carpinus fangiana]